MPYYETQPIIYPLHRLLSEVLTGEIRVPRFQRPGTETIWSLEQRGDLLDSIYRNFPIGTILLWSTTEEVGTIESVGGAAIPMAPEGRIRRRLVLDGHQRLSTLVSILGPATADYHRSTNESKLHDERWALDIADNSTARSSRDRFVSFRAVQDLSDKMLPLEVAFDRVSLNRWLRERSQLSRDEVRMADSLRDRLREYSVPVATLATESLDEATESFKRINSSGTPMSDFHMVTALAYSSDFDPQEEFARVRDEHLSPVGWGTMKDADLMRVCAGLVRNTLNESSQHPSKIKIDALARSLQEQPGILELAALGVASAARLLTKAGIHGPEILPYSWQIIVLAIALGSRSTFELQPDQEAQAIRWFWLSTYGGVFAGVNSSVVDRAGQALDTMMSGGEPTAMERDITAGRDEPTRFDFRAVRSRASLLSMARFIDRGDYSGITHRSLANGIESVHAIYSKLGRSCWYNLMIGTAAELGQVREAVWARVKGKSTPEQDRLLEAQGIAPGIDGSMDVLLEARRARLWACEKEFIQGIGMDMNVAPIQPTVKDGQPSAFTSSTLSVGVYDEGPP